MNHSIIKPLRPVDMSIWIRADKIPDLDIEHEVFFCREHMLAVISGVITGQNDIAAGRFGNEYAVTITRDGEMPSSSEIAWALSQFSLTNAKFDDEGTNEFSCAYYLNVLDHKPETEATRDEVPAPAPLAIAMGLAEIGMPANDPPPIESVDGEGSEAD